MSMNEQVFLEGHWNYLYIICQYIIWEIFVNWLFSLNDVKFNKYYLSKYYIWKKHFQYVIILWKNTSI